VVEAPPPSPWPARRHGLRFGRPVPGAQRSKDGWWLAWRGAAVMGVVNVTPDSFSDGGRWAGPEEAVEAGLRQAQAGALFVDVGGESSRPGAEGVPEAEELRRVLPVIEGLSGHGVRVSVDTVKPAVAEAAVAAGACLVNDIRGLNDPAMRRVCGDAGVPAVVMHMQGEPRSMQRAPRYRDVVGEVEAFLLERVELALADGVPGVMLDPGIGFGKRLEHNLALLAATARLAGHGLPLLVGASRKSLIQDLVGKVPPQARLPGTLALHLRAAQLGAAMLRAHDVAEHAQALGVLAAVSGAERRAEETGG